MGLVVACGGGKDAAPRRVDGGAPPPRRVIEPPRRDVRALPPHAIAAGGVGPYKLRTPLAEIMKSLPSGPRMALLQIPGVVDYGAARDDGLLIGGERQGDVSFIAVLREGIARTAGGIGVGAASAALEASLGPALERPNVARDPDLWIGAQLPGARFVLVGDRVLGVVLSPPGAPPAGRSAADPGVVRDDAVPAASSSTCARAPVTSESFAGLVPGNPPFRAGCFGSADGVAVNGNLIILAARATAEGRPRRIATVEVRGLRWAAPVRVDGERDEVIAVGEHRSPTARSYSVVAIRVDGTRVTKVAEAEVYRLDDQSAAWMGASLDDLALRIEVVSNGDTLTVGGLLVHAPPGQARTLAPLLEVTVRRRRTTGETPEVDRDRGRRDPTGANSATYVGERDAGVDAR